ncbi:hypothetical protein ACFOZ7_14680 [Natribaculum luteum]|uniref:Uncharacterized protein n=1 Tax=Natribaculum luteum TaxID=1586232 RepID=A0ABD5P2D5_9EURY|nr:hypothetical protein [Natribaculum luteum]
MSDIEDTQESSHCSQCDFEQLKALYQLNVEAKRYAESAEDAYTAGFKANARLYSLRKKALYGLKRAILEELVDGGCVDTIRYHNIDGKLYYCLYVGEFSFHTPTDEWDTPPRDAPPSPSKSLDSFDADPDNRTDHLSEAEALKRLTEQFETPNNYLPTPFVDRGYGSEFAGWSQLPGAIEEGDRVDGRFGREITNPYDEFLFAVGDTFQTKKGDCRILDRYQAWLTPWLDRAPIMPRTVYDVELDGEVRETVRQRRIVDDWLILVDSLDDPVPNVDGRQAEMAGDAYDRVAFDIGDIIELNAEWDDDGPHYSDFSHD